MSQYAAAILSLKDNYIPAGVKNDIAKGSNLLATLSSKAWVII
jgi:hypothetical protein